MSKRKVVVLSGSGISAESGIPTFRASDGLWAGYNIEEVATPEGWKKNRELVLEFYNERRKNALDAKPNSAHKTLARLESYFELTIITQNVDDLHERAGSSNVIHLHGELFKSRSSLDENLVYDIKGSELNIGDKCEKGSQLRPHIVWFGEPVPMMDIAAEVVMEADILIVVGTSLLVYPAAGLVDYVRGNVPIYVIDPSIPENIGYRPHVRPVQENATTGMKKVADELIENYVLKM
ncbi:NAD-dependent deacylase [Flammeovirgaceae bacterium SG7u.111]|nr:NAD-dependent deacylase [Flammeovirgaceae bacterium SG7u.132]WPO36760.1 NAD-dependent deacylase [Flammeovirgaceae bacterium SG7u.111]